MSDESKNMDRGDWESQWRPAAEFIKATVAAGTDKTPEELVEMSLAATPVITPLPSKIRERLIHIAQRQIDKAAV